MSRPLGPSDGAASDSLLVASRKHDVLVAKESVEDPAQACDQKHCVSYHEPHGFGGVGEFALCVQEARLEGVANEQDETDGKDAQDGKVNVEEVTAPGLSVDALEVLQVHGDAA